jgi:ssDNA-binding Zn-finger/Zn-ribbon topoisomerase 1
MDEEECPGITKKRCPDCGNIKMEDAGERFDVFTGLFKKSLQCTQCRRWIYDE